MVASLMAQMVFGGVDIHFGNKEEGRLPKILRQYQESNIPTDATRLGYTPPNAVHMNGALLQDSIRSIIMEGIEAAGNVAARRFRNVNPSIFDLAST